MDFENRLIDWYRQYGRHLPWRKKDPSFYEVLLSETMLQQTQVGKVLSYYGRFLDRYNTLEDLASAQEEDVLKLWEGLGYYSRCRNLLRTARALQEKGFVLPRTMEGLRELPGIGEYTANALLALCYHQKAIAVDGNLVRVHARLEECALADDRKRKESCRDYFLSRLKESDPSDFNQALMDLGEMVCLPHGKPLCHSCPLSSFCKARKNDTVHLYPPKKEKTKRKACQMTVFLIQCQDRFLIRKRPEKGLLASLHEFVNVEGFLTEEEAMKALSAQGLTISSIRFLGKGRHVFSHLVWDMIAYHVTLEEPCMTEKGIWASKADIERAYSIPSAFAFVKDRLV